MPRLFVSHRQQPQQRQSARARAPSSATPTAASAAPAVSTVVSVQVPSFTPPTSVVMARPLPNASSDEPVVLVPPLPKHIAKLMDTHDLDNPYLVASFQVLMANDNNPMRVPDILQAVQVRGWSQVLHRHKDRPEQLFGNALRSHQRRREQMGKPSLVFMIDAGSCWKHHQIDLSAASGRKKGKIWCFSKAAGFACPYTRLGMDLDVIIRAQEGGAGGGKGDDDEDEPEKPAPKAEPSRKKRKLAPSKPAAAVTGLFEEAVRGVVTSTQPVTSLESPSYNSAATININSQGGHSSAGARAGQLLPLEVVSRGSMQTRNRSRKVIEQPIEQLDLDALEAMSPEPMPMEELEDELMEDPSWTRVAPTPQFSAVSIPQPELNPESDDDDDDFHVTMRRFQAPPSSPVRSLLNGGDIFASAAPSPMEDLDSNNSDGSMVRTPTPPLVSDPNDIASWTLAASNVDMYPHDGAFHSVGMDFGGWDANSVPIKIESEDQGWSRAGSPFDFARSHDIDPEKTPLEPVELDTLPFPASALVEALSAANSRASSVSREGSVFSLRSVRSNLTSRSSLSAPVAIPLPDGHDRESRRMSVMSHTSSRPHSPHPLILYSPALTPSSMDSERPFIKSGLAHHYLLDVQTDEMDTDEQTAGVKELEGLLNLGDDAEADVELPPQPSMLVAATAVARPIAIKRPRSPSF